MNPMKRRLVSSFLRPRVPSRPLLPSGARNGRLLCASARGKETLGLIGLGKMGSSLSSNLLEAGYPVVVYDIDTHAVQAQVLKGARAASSAQEVTSQVATVITMLPNDEVLCKVAGGPGTGMLEGMRPGSLHISCSTVSPTTSRRLAAVHKAKGARFIGAPVFARPDGLAAKAAYFVVGGDKESIQQAEPILLCTGSKVYDFGEDPGAGNVVKLVGNFLIASSIEAIAEALALAESNGLDRAEVMSMLTGTIFDCLIYKGYGDRISRRDHSPGGFALELGLKDVSLVRSTAVQSHVPMPLASLLQDRFMAAHQRGRGGLDWSALALSASEESGVDVTRAIETSSRHHHATSAPQQQPRGEDASGSTKS